MTTLFVNQLTNIDSAYLHPTRGLVGETWIVDLQLHGVLDAQGMMMDFGIIKHTIRDAIEDELDHKLLVPMQSPQLQISDSLESLTFTYGDGLQLKHQSPAVAICPIDAQAITQQAMILAIIKAITPVLSDNVARVSLQLRHEEIEGAYYHYCHGLKKHAGNCQRIAHGHRSRIHVYSKGQRQHQVEQRIASDLADCYIGTTSDLVSTEIVNGVECHTFAYHAPQGAFSLSLPTQHCHLIETDSTVEHIAGWLYHRLEGDAHVHAFEGINKGAIAAA